MQEKGGVNIPDIINEEIVAMAEKILENKCIATNY